MSKELAIVLPTNALEVYSCDGIEDMISKIEKHARSIAPDLTTDKGRKAVASNAAQVSRSKTALDALGKGLVSGWKEKAKAVDVERKLMRDRLDDLRDEVRQPLNDWEHEQKAIAIAKLAAAELLEAHSEALEDNVYFDRERDIRLREEEFDRKEAARLAQIKAENDARHEAERVERERLAQIEADKQAAIDQAAHDARVAEEAAQAVQDAADELVRDAEERANKLRLEAEKEKRAALVAEEKAKFEIERAERKAQQAIKDAEEKAEYEAKVAADAQARREANTRHVGLKRKQAKEDLIAVVGLSEAQAKKVVVAIYNGNIANLSIKY